MTKRFKPGEIVGLDAVGYCCSGVLGSAMVAGGRGLVLLSEFGMFVSISGEGYGGMWCPG